MVLSAVYSPGIFKTSLLFSVHANVFGQSARLNKSVFCMYKIIILCLHNAVNERSGLDESAEGKRKERIKLIFADADGRSAY